MRLWVCCPFWLGNNFLRNWLEKGMNKDAIKLCSAFFRMYFLQLLWFPACRSHKGNWPLYVQRFLSHRRHHLERHHNTGARKNFLVTKASENINCIWVLLSLILVLVFLSSLSTLGYPSSSYSETIQLMLHAPRFTWIWAFFLQRHFQRVIA